MKFPSEISGLLLICRDSFLWQPHLLDSIMRLDVYGSQWRLIWDGRYDVTSDDNVDVELI